MFFRRKNQDDLCCRLEGQLTALNQNFDQLRNDTFQAVCRLEDSMNQNVSRLEDCMGQNLLQLKNDIHQLQSDVHKHDMSLEDLLDEWDEKKSDEDSVKTQLEESAQTEKLLLALFEAYQEQFWALKHYAASKDESWMSQIACMEKTLQRYQRSCAISLIQECGVHVDYDLHDVIEAIDTADPELDKTIAEIYRCGYLYKGKVRKKAQTAAYRFTARV